MVGMVPNLKKPEIVRSWLDLLLGKTCTPCWRRIDKYWDRHGAYKPVKTCHPGVGRPSPGSRYAP